MTTKALTTSLISALLLFGVASTPAFAQTTTGSTPNLFCAYTYNLYRGVHDASSNGQVSELQQFLASQGYTQPVTGYFGPLTYGNLVRYQRHYGIYATGYFGPITRAYLNHFCAGSTGGTTVGGLTVTSPTQGQVVQNGTTLPISWNYPVTPGSASMKIELYTSTGTLVGLIAISNNTIGTYSWSVPPYPNNRLCAMIYPNGLCGTNLLGQYYVQVSAVSGTGYDQSPTVYATGRSGIFTITRSGTQTNTYANPTSGAVPLTVTFNPGSYTGPYAISFGDGTNASMLTGSVMHTYNNRGTYTATLTSDAACRHTTPACMIATMFIGNATITVY